MRIDPTTKVHAVRACARTFAVLLVGFAAAGCGSSPCEDAVAALCKKACECGKCGLAAGDENAHISLFYDSEADCEATANCDDSKGTDAEFEACAGDADGAACSDGAVVIPESCNEKD